MNLKIEIREMAVEAVDKRHGYTMEFAPSPAQHRALYDLEEERLTAEIAADPGRLICPHEDRAVPLGGGQFVCFACFGKLCHR